MRLPTKRQLEWMHALDELTAELGYAPTFRQLAEHMGCTSTNGVTDQMKSLRDKGWVAWEPRLPRTLRVVKWPKGREPACHVEREKRA